MHLVAYLYEDNHDARSLKHKVCYPSEHGGSSFAAASTSLTLITPCSRILEKPIGPQLVKKFHEFCGTRRFVTATTTACHFSLS
jgi:hypothetical protein